VFSAGSTAAVTAGLLLCALAAGRDGVGEYDGRAGSEGRLAGLFELCADVELDARAELEALAV
jgi:hypothetical protein